jgi:uncharacterized repeat protein (TIGR03803 family)
MSLCDTGSREGSSSCPSQSMKNRDRAVPTAQPTARECGNSKTQAVGLRSRSSVVRASLFASPTPPASSKRCQSAEFLSRNLSRRTRQSRMRWRRCYGNGAVFKLSPSGRETGLYSFTGATDGNSPFAGLLRDRWGNLYGTTNSGGTHGDGVVFKLSPSGTETCSTASGTGRMVGFLREP